MASRYEKIWNAIKKSYEAKNPALRAVVIRCRASKVDTIVLAVKKIKSAENQTRIALDLGRYGKLKIERKYDLADNSMAKILFTLQSPDLAERL